ncbi:MAG TPA: UPF0175 family protein [Candidatus Nanoarchaeia archaeon]|nr:UPF0175 family protein [Candidatus Nanoarchaeia archaeon]
MMVLKHKRSPFGDNDSRAQMRVGAAIEMYKKEEVTLSKTAEIAGLNLFEFKEVLKDRGIKIILSHLSKEQLKRGTEVIKRLRTR